MKKDYRENCQAWAEDLAVTLNTRTMQALSGELYFPNKYERNWYIDMARYCETKTDLLVYELADTSLTYEDVNLRMKVWRKWMEPMLQSLELFMPGE